MYTQCFDTVFDKEAVGGPQRVDVLLRSLVGTGECGEDKSEGRVHLLTTTVVLPMNGNRRLVLEDTLVELVVSLLEIQRGRV